MTLEMKRATRLAASKIFAPDALVPIRGSLSGVVFTNGCFDLLHSGHVAYLEQARALGGALIVALNTDRSVAELKGPTRPLNPLQARMIVLAALESVDYVTWFDEPTPLALIQRLQPEWITKGGDWAPESIVGAQEARAWGGSVKSLPFLAGHSTTATIAKARTFP